jgi:hypothetical protein
VVVALVYREEFSVTPPSPERAPAPPVAVERLVGVDSFGFGDSVVIVEATDGGIHYYQWDMGWGVWSSDRTGSTYEEGGECGREALAELTAAAGPLVECQTGAIWTERCPIPSAAYALAADGSIWRLVHLKPCSTIFFSTLCIGLPLAALASVALWLIVKFGAAVVSRDS